MDASLINVSGTSELSTEEVSLDQWLVLRDQVVGQVRRLVYLWFANKLGSQRELAKHLGLSSSTVNYHVKTLRSAGELSEQQCPTDEQRSKNARCSKFEHPVENSTPTQPTAIPTNVQPTRSPVCPPLLSVVPELEPEREDGITYVNGVPMGSDQQRSLAEHWHNVQQSDAPESYKQAQFLLGQLEVLLSGARRDGWQECHYYYLHQELASYARSCDAASRDYGARLEAECEAQYQAAISRINGGSELLG
jgi:DNA-binding Lrp family transcriptional regulator